MTGDRFSGMEIFFPPASWEAPWWYALYGSRKKKVWEPNLHLRRKGSDSGAVFEELTGDFPFSMIHFLSTDEELTGTGACHLIAAIGHFFIADYSDPCFSWVDLCPRFDSVAMSLGDFMVMEDEIVYSAENSLWLEQTYDVPTIETQ